MKIQYLKSLEKHPTLAGWSNEGMTLDEIRDLEQQYLNGESFPQSYKEFLFLAGKNSYIEADILDWDWMVESAEEQFEENNIPPFKRPIWITDQVDQCEQFGFIYLDEDSEDPIIYNCRPAYVSRGMKLIESRPQGKFSSYIYECVERAKFLDRC